MEASALYEAPFTSLHAGGPDELFGGKEQVIEGIFDRLQALETDFAPEKLVARSLLDKPEAFRGGHLMLLVCDDPFVNAVTGGRSRRAHSSGRLFL